MTIKDQQPRLHELPYSTPIVELVYLDKVWGHAPSKMHEGDAGYDLYVSEDVELAPQSFTDVHTGIAIKLPDGYFARITGRSSTVRTKRLQVQEGIIDNGYTGELFIGVWNLNGHRIKIKRGERVAQMIVQAIVPVYFRLTDELPDTPRGKNGFGSTGS